MDGLTSQLNALLAVYVNAKLPQTDDYSPIEAERRDQRAHDTAMAVCDLLLRAGTRELAGAVH